MAHILRGPRILATSLLRSVRFFSAAGESIMRMHVFRRQSATRCRPWLLAVALMCAVNTGCVIRRMTVNTNVPGAVAYVDDVNIGRTPASTPFTYYGTRKVMIVADGYETLTVYHKFKRPWYEYPILEFFSESLWPWEIDDLHELNFDLVPQQVVSASDTVARAETLRQNARQGIVAPLPEQLPGAMGPPQILPAPPPVGQPTPAMPELLPPP